MPIYEYKCTVCDEHLDIEQRISEDTLTSIEGCGVAKDGDHQLKKVFSAVGIAFKGEGFYRNDARGSSSSSSSSSSPSGSSSSSDSSSSGSSDSSSSDSSSTSSDSGSSSSNSGAKSASSSSSSTSSSD